MATSQDYQAAIDSQTSELSNFQASQKNPLDLFNEASASLGIPEVRERVSSLRKSLLDTENLLSGVEGSVKGRTAGSLVTEAQRQRLTALERQPLAEEARLHSGNYNNEVANLSDRMGQAQNLTNLSIAGQAQKESALRTKLEGSQSAYQRALAAEQEARRQHEWETTQAESKRQFEAKMAADNAKTSAANADNQRYLRAQDIISSLPGGFGQYHNWGQVVEKLRKEGYSEGEITKLNGEMAARFGSQEDRDYFNV